jgi:hypothetical protein
MSGGIPVGIAFLDKRIRNSIGCGLPMAVLLSWANGIANQPIWELESGKTQPDLGLF